MKISTAIGQESERERERERERTLIIKEDIIKVSGSKRLIQNLLNLI